MRKIVNVCGVNAMKGKSKKTGKEYDFVELHFTYQDGNVIGLKCANATVDRGIVGDRDIMVGEDLDMVFHTFNGRVYVDAVL